MARGDWIVEMFPGCGPEDIGVLPVSCCGHSVDQFNPNVSTCAAHAGVVSIIVLNVFYDTVVIDINNAGQLQNASEPKGNQ